MRKPRLLDLFCGAGGCAVGYTRAGFEVVGVDKLVQKNFPYDLIRADALAVVRGQTALSLDWFDVIHASPPCQAFSVLGAMHPDIEHADLVAPTRDALIEWGGPYIIENVPGAPLIDPVTLCGTSFGLGAREMDLRRHRLFESNVSLMAPACKHSSRKTIGVYGHGGHTGKRRMAHAGEAKEALGIDWMTRDEMAQAIPPAYTEWLGRQLLGARLVDRLAERDADAA